MKILNKLTLRNLLINKKRTIITIFGISLFSMLLFSVATSLATYKDLYYQMAVNDNGDQQVINNDVPLDKETVFSNNDIEKYYYISKVGNIEYLNNHITLYSINDKFYGDIDLEGKLPNDNREIVISAETAKIKKLIIGDKYEVILDEETKKFEVVGIFNSNRLFDYNTALTKDDNVTTGRFYVYFNSYDDISNKIGKVSYDLGFSLLNDSRVDVNKDLMSLYTMYGEGAYSQAVMILVSMFLMLIIGFIVLFIIYNSFAISVNERKKAFAMYKSIGSTKNQILKTVLFEGFVLSIIAIPIGFILNLVVGFIAISVINGYLSQTMLLKFNLSFDITFIMISLFYIFSCIFISCFMPAKRASESTIINTIRQNTEFTKKGSIFKENKMVSKLFKIEGVISRKNTH